MSFKFKEEVTTEYEVDAVIMNFMDFDAFNDVRKDIVSCRLCKRGFEKGEGFVHLAMLKRHHNRLFCDECADAAIQNGAEGMDSR